MSRTTFAFTVTGVAMAAAAMGCAAGVLLAPASGPETRRRLSRRIEESRHDMSRTCERAIQRAVSAARQEIARRVACAREFAA